MFLLDPLPSQGICDEGKERSSHAFLDGRRILARSARGAVFQALNRCRIDVPHDICIAVRNMTEDLIYIYQVVC